MSGTATATATPPAKPGRVNLGAMRRGAGGERRAARLDPVRQGVSSDVLDMLAMVYEDEGAKVTLDAVRKRIAGAATSRGSSWTTSSGSTATRPCWRTASSPCWARRARPRR